ncbi:bifunctional DNA primase/polymerase [Leuconostoc citreum]|uniref:bifunctional DNA primase/polymerase n=1 Tax=Leuconostoc citreum TaxID=33964 RepID=UPI001FB862DF|nr:bifunctional DNA primase/polymerase [Leuconostoc citreum]MCJ2166808.1 bifunctional DNA primase/polymerase [Leuconostoc citreum]
MNEDTKKAPEQKFGDRVQETNNDPIITSIDLIKQGLPVYLMQPKTSIPYKGSRGHLDAVSDEIQLRKLFAEARTNSNIGLNLNDTGIVVLDIDRHVSNGFKSLLDAGYKLNLDDEVWEMTPKSGAHIFFKVPKNVSVKNLKHNLLDGVELLKDHVTVATSSRMVDGKEVAYKHFGGNITNCSVMPKWLIDLASNVPTRGDKQTKRVPRYSIDQRLEMLINGFQQGERNNQIMSFAGWLLSIRNIDPNLVYELVQKINSESAVPLPSKEVYVTFKSAYDREVGRASLGGR